MKQTVVISLLVASVIAECVISLVIMHKMGDVIQEPVAVNRCLKSIEMNYGNESRYDTSLDYAVIDSEGNLIFQTNPHTTHTIHEAIKNRDTILDLVVDGHTIGKVVFLNTVAEQIDHYKTDILLCMIIISLIQALIIFVYLLYLNRRVLRPFAQMKDFAVRVASGNLDVPITLDRGHVFGAFTESFDLMRDELKKARTAEKRANDEKKEVIAKLSHDIKTPVASIKSTSEIGYELALEPREKELFNTVNTKCDQIVTLTDNLFNSSVREITEIAVNASSYPSEVVEELVRNADYLNRATIPTMPACHVFIDKLRLQQAFDNVFMNSYKYADTPIHVTGLEDREYLSVTVADEGEGVTPEELPLLTEKYHRGSNTHEKEGAGLGLHLVDYYLKKMDGYIILESEGGFSVTFYIRKVL